MGTNSRAARTSAKQNKSNFQWFDYALSASLFCETIRISRSTNTGAESCPRRWQHFSPMEIRASQGWFLPAEEPTSLTLKNEPTFQDFGKANWEHWVHKGIHKANFSLATAQGERVKRNSFANILHKLMCPKALHLASCTLSFSFLLTYSGSLLRPFDLWEQDSPSPLGVSPLPSRSLFLPFLFILFQLPLPPGWERRQKAKFLSWFLSVHNLLFAVNKRNSHKVKTPRCSFRKQRATNP